MNNAVVIPTALDAILAGQGSSSPSPADAPDASELDAEACSVCWGFGTGDDGDPCPRCQGTGCA
jgi:hypothetical protein